MGDDWINCPNEDGSADRSIRPLKNACYIWLPIQFTEKGVVINWCSEWDLDDPFAPCPSSSPAPGSVAGCKVSSQPAIGDAVALADCEDGPGQTWNFSGSFRQLTWETIS